MGALLALASAACYGIADFAGGLLARRTSHVPVALLGQLGGLAVMLVAAPLVGADAVAGRDLAAGALSGVGTGVGMLFLYRGLARGGMSVVVPVSAVGGIALPVVAGVLVFGDRPSVTTWAGVVVAVPAIWLVSGSGGRGGAGGPAVVDGLVASVGIAVQYLALAQAGPSSGLWPVTAGRVTAVAAIALAMRPSSRSLRVRPPLGVGAAATGGVAALALVCYLLATRQDLMVVAVVLSSLYPVLPVVLGVTVLRERLAAWQVAGLAGAAVATVLVAAG